jgi:serine/threonine-protein kinase
MAVITSECMTGVRPFDGSTFGELLLNICARPIAPPSSQGLHLPGFDAWFARATSRDPEQRFASAQELASTLRDVIQGNGAPVARAAPYAPSNPSVSGATAAQAASGHGAAPSVSSINTSHSYDARRTTRVWPWLLASATVLAGGAGVVLFARRASNETTPQEKVPPSATAAAQQPAAPQPERTTAVTAEAAAPKNRLAPEPAPGGREAHTAAVRSEAAPSNPAASAISSTASSTAPVAGDRPSPGSAAPSSGKALRCTMDPFTGQIRSWDAVRGGEAFACKQDPFTGKYKRL